ncbi:MAG TPA: hypothetical protein VIH89_08430 [Candidatus Sulfotelmatobacter sp.]
MYDIGVKRAFSGDTVLTIHDDPDLPIEERMFARKIRVEYEVNGQKRPCPLKWLDSFSMRNFTNAGVFDDTLPVGDGDIEIGSNVPLDRLKDAMEDWFRRKGYLAKDSGLSLTQDLQPHAK